MYMHLKWNIDYIHLISCQRHMTLEVHKCSLALDLLNSVSHHVLPLVQQASARGVIWPLGVSDWGIMHSSDSGVVHKILAIVNICIVNVEIIARSNNWEITIFQGGTTIFTQSHLVHTNINPTVNIPLGQKLCKKRPVEDDMQVSGPIA